mmetsp:Transcript_12688/g.16671  ORF Transcript_12688/g.16671 Transcript_12688/m.16671 type:complete len:346 (-) Transcript_12688:158-1195(-)
MKTRITSLLKIEKPIILPGMSWISTPSLVSAVSNAGGLGILATGPLNADETRSAIREIRKKTERPFGIGCTLLMPGAKENAEVALEEKVPVINFSLGKGDWITAEAHSYGGKVIATVVTEKHARSAEQIGVDALMVTGHEAAAHGGFVTSFVLVPSICEKVSLPVIAAGGVGDGRGLLAALSLGADAVAMGSRLAASQESPLPENVKKMIVEKTEGDTIYSKNFDGLYARVMKTPAAERATRRPMNPIMAAIKSIEAAKYFKMPLSTVLGGLFVQYDKILMLAQFGAATEKLIAATVDGDLETGVQFIGQTQGLINDTPSVQQILERVIEQATQEYESKSSIFQT